MDLLFSKFFEEDFLINSKLTLKKNFTLIDIIFQ